MLFLPLSGKSQSQDTIRWNAEWSSVSDSEVQVRLRGFLAPGWRLYSANPADELAGPRLRTSDSLIRMAPISVSGTPISWTDSIFNGNTQKGYADSLVLTTTLNFHGALPPTLKLIAEYELSRGTEFLTEEKIIRISLNDSAAQPPAFAIKRSSIDLDQPLSDCGVGAEAPEDTASKSLTAIFFIGFLGGLIALITPCVFPMIPLTVSFFTKKATDRRTGLRNAFLYGFFIFLIYVLLSLPFHFLDSVNPEFLNNLSTSVVLNVAFFLIFLFFAFSFFGYYEITLPASLTTGVDSKAGSGNILGIFFMALTLAIVSFSCTGPILGSLLAGSLTADGGALKLTLGMAGFGLALALPFALFALFPQWLQSLPRSGGWLNTVKVTLGFLELALAFKFLSNADLVKHWGLLKREVFIGIWVLTGIGLSLYLFGLIRFAHDNPAERPSWLRRLVATLTALFTLYLIPGLTNTEWANLRLISGFPPPLYYSIYAKDSECVLGLQCTHDYEEGLAMARAEGKAVLIDFTGYACVNCRRMEENVWSDPEVYRYLKDHFIVVSLYVDDKKALPAAKRQVFRTAEGEKEIETYGDLWATFETENFANNAQPLYAVLNHGEQLLNAPVGYTPDPQQYLRWLTCAWNTFTKK